MSNGKKCLFCEKYDLGDGVIWENEFFYALFDAFPVSPGHAEVIPKRHVESLLELTSDEWVSLKDALCSVVKYIEGADLVVVYGSMLEEPLNESSERFCLEVLEQLERCGKPGAYNYGVNDGEAAGRTIHHLHIHIIPRYVGDVGNPRGGVRNIIPNKGNY